jgi:type II secretory pathway component PulF
LDEVIAQVQAGKPLADPLEEEENIPDMVTQMIRIAEETGKLDTMLARVGEHYDKAVERTTKTLTRLLEPMVIVIMTVVIGFIAASVILPLADLTTKFK